MAASLAAPQGFRNALKVATMSRAVRKKLGWTLKRRRWAPPSETKMMEVLGEAA
jgi:hypothetical protein